MFATSDALRHLARRGRRPARRRRRRCAGGRAAAAPPDPATRAVRLEADLRARDFTVDALARPLDGDELVDPLSGLDDLAAGRLRLCSPAALDDDPLRVLRLARLARVFDLVPDAAATEAALPRGAAASRA